MASVIQPEKLMQGRSPGNGTPAVKSPAPTSGDIKFYFCETCGKRITDRQILEGQGRDKKLKGIFCSDCAVGVNTMEFDAITEADLRNKPTRKSGGIAKVPSSGFKATQLEARTDHSPAKSSKPVAGPAPGQGPSALPPGIKPFAAMIAAAAALTLLGAFVLFSNAHSPKNVAKVEPVANVEKENSNAPPLEPMQGPLPPRVDAPAVTSTLASTAINDPEASAKGAFDALQRFDGLAADDNAGRIERIDAFLSQHGDAIISGRARALRKELAAATPKPDREAVAKSDYDTMVKKIGTLEKGDSTGRLALVDAFLKDHGDSEMASAAKTLRDGIAAVEQFNKTHATLPGLPDQPPGTTTSAAELPQTKVADGDVATLKMIQQTLVPLAQSDFPAALRAIAQNPDATAESRNALKLVLDALRKRDGLWRDALVKNVGHKIKLETRTGGVEGVVLAVDGDTLKIEKPLVINGATMGSATVQIAVGDILPVSREALAPLPAPAGDEWMGQVLGALARQDFEAADKALTHCDGHVLYAAIKQLEAAEQGAAREVKAQTLWKKAEDLFAAKNWKAAKLVYEGLQRDFAATALVKYNAESLQKRLDEIETTLLASQAVTLDLGGVKLDLMPIPAGEFEMGSNDEPNEKPIHKVRITHPFCIGKYPVTQAQYEKVMGVNPSQVKGDNLPEDHANYDDAKEFCKKASKLTGKNIRLPTEAEWEYACRAGTRTKYYTGDNEAALDQAGWYDKNSGGKPRPVGQKKPNAWGLYDMHGMVWQFCIDGYAADAYSKTTVDDPEIIDGKECVMRGGARTKGAATCRSAARGSIWRSDRSFYDAYGFRVVLSATPAKK